MIGLRIEDRLPSDHHQPTCDHLDHEWDTTYYLRGTARKQSSDLPFLGFSITVLKEDV